MQASQPVKNVAAPKPGEHGIEYLGRDAEPRRNVYVWELPVRLTHWMNVLSIGVLTVTGIFIAWPFIGTGGRASDQFLMGSIRFTHFVAAFVFTISVLVRIYWMFMGNKWASWKQFIP